MADWKYTNLSRFTVISTSNLALRILTRHREGATQPIVPASTPRTVIDRRSPTKKSGRQIATIFCLVIHHCNPNRIRGKKSREDVLGRDGATHDDALDPGSAKNVLLG